MIQAVESKPGEGMTLRTVSFQGTQLSAGQRRAIELQQQVRQSFLAGPLLDQVQQLEADLDRRKEQGAQPENPNKFTLDYASKGTPWLGDVFGY